VECRLGACSGESVLGRIPNGTNSGIYVCQLREMSYEGKNTIAMVYDNFPVIDYFRFVTPDLVAGAMDSKILRECGTYYFFLTRIR
jgi:hypothetical protein